MARTIFRNSLLIAGTALSLLIVAAVVILVDDSSPDSVQATDVATGSATQASGARTGLAQSSDQVRLKVSDGRSIFASIIDPTAMAGSTLDAVGVPTTLLLDSRGRELGRLVGATDWDSSVMVSFLKGTINDGHR